MTTMTCHRIVVTLLLVLATLLALLYVSTFAPEAASAPVPMPAVERAPYRPVGAPGNRLAVVRLPNVS
ncbi:hypothetical protein ACS5PN_16540 [Roseateles sp. NT4]|uniref:hypothetical protein n=1 Tax=Roseateles sp. NT4 TaxID=3453715 RepID=UPI003EEB00DD